MLLYHGSNMIIDEIDLAKSRPYKDFGKAFYLSADEKQAREMAKFKVLTGGGSAEISVFEFDELSLDGLKVKRFEEYTEERERKISLAEFLKNLHYYKGITFQYAFCTPLAISKLKKV